jgi:hypothetical protein
MAFKFEQVDDPNQKKETATNKSENIEKTARSTDKRKKGGVR